MSDKNDPITFDAFRRGMEVVKSERIREKGGAHYTTKAIQPWDAMRSWMTHEQFAGFLRGNAIKYLSRAGTKDGEPALKDYEKALHYVEKLIETEKTNAEK